ncbi:hypothetical protein ACXYMU_11310 [Pontibacter sp. CAU 1760]
MKNLWTYLQKLTLPVAMLLVYFAAIAFHQQNTVPDAPALGTQNTSEPITPSLSQTKDLAAQQAPAPDSKSVLDAEVLNNPLAYFKDAFAGEEDKAEGTPSADPIILTFKALVAVLLSTIM